MFKYFLNLSNSMTYKGLYEIHKKNCPIVKQLMTSPDVELVDLGFHDSSSSAAAAAEKILEEKGLASSLLNGCLACCKEYHKR